ncbi:hypothetical protein BH11MYX3_BH11MYX3_13760 [soil metagenome]
MAVIRFLKILVGALVLWLAVLVIVGVVYVGRAGDRVASRIADSLVAEVTLDGSNLALIRGHLVLDKLVVRKEDLGHLAIDIDRIRCELPPLGIGLIDHECRDLIVSGVRLEVSAAAVFQLRNPKRKPMRVRHVEIDDAVLTFSPSAFLPSLGRISIKIDHAEAGPTTFKTPLSWIFTMTSLAATIELPAGITVKLAYANGLLTAAGGIFGSAPVALPLSIPIPQSTDDAKQEVKKLVELGSELAEQLVARRAEDWLKQKLTF